MLFPGPNCSMGVCLYVYCPAAPLFWIPPPRPAPLRFVQCNYFKLSLLPSSEFPRIFPLRSLSPLVISFWHKVFLGEKPAGSAFSEGWHTHLPIEQWGCQEDWVKKIKKKAFKCGKLVRALEMGMNCDDLEKILIIWIGIHFENSKYIKSRENWNVISLLLLFFLNYYWYDKFHLWNLIINDWNNQKLITSLAPSTFRQP